MLKKLLELLGVYRAYEYWLNKQIRNKPIPSHVGIILDGNRRWAELKGLPATAGHDVGAKVAQDLLGWAEDLGIKTLTLYVLSTENLNRKPEEVSHLLSLAEDYLKRMKENSELSERRVRIKFMGNKALLPERIQKIMEEIEKSTSHYDSFFLNLAIAYGGRQEIVDMVRSIANDVKDSKIKVEEINQQMIRKYLYTSHLPNPEPDIVIRTSGEERLSGFLLWQSAYSELIFFDVYWPDFRKIDLMRAVRIYQSRSRRFGL
ncbi:MAG: polyprenyl diphosphate synthase [Nitrososphaeria archaeon]